MNKKVGVFLFSVVIFLSIFSVVFAHEDSANNSGALVDFQDENAVLEETEGITPDSAFYFVDDFFDNFGDEVKIRQEKVAEIRAMIENENYDAALEALDKYRKYADELEKEVSPEQKDEARQSAAAIYNVLTGLEEQIPEEYKKDFVDDIVDREGRIVTSAEISNKIKELCETLSEIDPLQYSRVCRTDDDAPRWQKELDSDLTKKQKEEAENFGRIMQQCFETSGQQCNCEEIPFTEFAKTCSIAAPLAIKCDIEGNEQACEKLDNLEMPEMPEYLQKVFDSLERDISESRFDLHMPRECVEAGAKTPKECSRIMIELNAPPECKEALLKASVQSEREGREICEKIMFELNAPQECIDQGIQDFRECGKLMFQLYAPQECIDAGLTGENRGDERVCREIAPEKFGGPRGPEEGRGANINLNCKTIENPDERLACYDRATSQAESYHGFDEANYSGPCMTKSDWRNKKEECRSLYGEHAGDEPVYGDSGEGYECVVDAKCVDFRQFEEESKSSPWEGCENLYCGPGQYCEYGQCKYFEGYIAPGEGGGEFVTEEGFGPDSCENVVCGETSHCESGQCVPNEYAPGEGPGEPSDSTGETPSDTTNIETNSPTTEDGNVSSTDIGTAYSGTSSGDSGTSTSTDTTTDSGVTGAIIANRFTNYYFSR